MQIAVDLESIKLRAEILRLKPSQLAELAGKTPSVAIEALKPGANPTAATVNALDGALTALEQNVLRHLLGRFGKPELYEQVLPPDTSPPKTSEAVAA